MFQVLIRLGDGEPERIRLDRFPFVIGRGAEVSHTIRGPGIWDRHLRFELDTREGLRVVAEPGALVTHEGKTLEVHRVRNGDEFKAGSVTLQVHLAPPVRRSLRAWEVVLWLLFAGVVTMEVVLAVQLLTG